MVQGRGWSLSATDASGRPLTDAQLWRTMHGLAAAGGTLPSFGGAYAGTYRPGYGVVPPGGGGSLYGAYQSAYNAAQSANLSRYSDILGQYGALYGRTMTGLEGLGDEQRRAISSRYGALAGANQQDLVSRGLAGTTVLPSMRLGVERQKTQELNALEEQLRRERMGYDVALTGERLGFMERRTDQYPDYGPMMSMYGQYGQAGGQWPGAAPPYYGPPTYGYGAPVVRRRPVAQPAYAVEELWPPPRTYEETTSRAASGTYDGFTLRWPDYIEE